jgi:TRAP-type uncharacterized transport system fused permease subunit
MAYSPMLGMGKDYSLMHWEVGITMLTCGLGLVAFAAALERYLIRKANLIETALFGLAATGLFWPTYWSDLAGAGCFVLAIVLQKMVKPAEAA